MWQFEFQNMLFGYGRENHGYCVEYWVCFFGIVVSYKKPNGIRGIIKQDNNDQT